MDQSFSPTLSFDEPMRSQYARVLADKESYDKDVVDAKKNREYQQAQQERASKGLLAIPREQYFHTSPSLWDEVKGAASTVGAGIKKALIPEPGTDRFHMMMVGSGQAEPFSYELLKQRMNGEISREEYDRGVRDVGIAGLAGTGVGMLGALGAVGLLGGGAATTAASAPVASGLNVVSSQLPILPTAASGASGASAGTAAGAGLGLAGPASASLITPAVAGAGVGILGAGKAFHEAMKTNDTLDQAAARALNQQMSTPTVNASGQVQAQSQPQEQQQPAFNPVPNEPIGGQNIVQHTSTPSIEAPSSAPQMQQTQPQRDAPGLYQPQSVGDYSQPTPYDQQAQEPRVAAAEAVKAATAFNPAGGPAFNQALARYNELDGQYARSGNPYQSNSPEAQYWEYQRWSERSKLLESFMRALPGIEQQREGVLQNAENQRADRGTNVNLANAQAQNQAHRTQDAIGNQNDMQRAAFEHGKQLKFADNAQALQMQSNDFIQRYGLQNEVLSNQRYLAQLPMRDRGSYFWDSNQNSAMGAFTQGRAAALREAYEQQVRGKTPEVRSRNAQLVDWLVNELNQMALTNDPVEVWLQYMTPGERAATANATAIKNAFEEQELRR